MRFKGLAVKELLQIVLTDTLIIVVINLLSLVDWTTAVAIYLATFLVSSFTAKK